MEPEVCGGEEGDLLGGKGQGWEGMPAMLWGWEWGWMDRRLAWRLRTENDRSAQAEGGLENKNRAEVRADRGEKLSRAEGRRGEGKVRWKGVEEERGERNNSPVQRQNKSGKGWDRQAPNEEEPGWEQASKEGGRADRRS